MIADRLTKCWYGVISTYVCGGNYDDDVTALTITATDGQKRTFRASQNGIQPRSSHFYAFIIPFNKIIYYYYYYYYYYYWRYLGEPGVDGRIILKWIFRK